MPDRISDISTSELEQCFHDSDTQIIDVRPVEAYNGWKLKGEKRGGHIEGARSLPAKWSDYIDWIEIVRNKDILPSQKIVIYGYDNQTAEKVAMRFKKAGYPNIVVYRDFLTNWVNNDRLPMQYLSRYRHLVSAEWLKELSDTGKAAEYNNTRFVICHAHYRNPADYDAGHIPGSVSVDTNTLESPETWNRRSPQELKNTLESLGIDKDTTVILYGRFSFPDNDDPFPGSSAGHLGSIRAAAIMLYAGVEDVRILNGGLQSWTDSGFEVIKEPQIPHSVENFGTEIPAHPEYFIDTSEAEAYLASSDKNLVSVRSWPEYIGEVSGYNYIEKKGRIPGSVFGNCGSDAYHMENYRNLDHTMREFHETEKIWKAIGVTPDKYNAFYCGTGWRGSEAFMNAWLMGWPNVSVYDGGWFEWSNLGKPFETGIPKNQ